MKIVMDADCLIKLTKAQLKEAVCEAFVILVPRRVREEVMVNASEHPECPVIEANLNRGALTEVPGVSSQAKGEEAALALYQAGPCAGIATDDKRFARRLQMLGVPYVTPGVFVWLLVKRGRLTVDEGLGKLERLAPLVSDDEIAVVRLKLATPGRGGA